MKHIGLIGGLSPESTVHYYQILCREYNRELGGLNFPEITLESLNLQQLVTLFEKNDWDGVAAILLNALHRLKKPARSSRRFSPTRRTTLTSEFAE